MTAKERPSPSMQPIVKSPLSKEVPNSSRLSVLKGVSPLVKTEFPHAVLPSNLLGTIIVEECTLASNKRNGIILTKVFLVVRNTFIKLNEEFAIYIPSEKCKRLLLMPKEELRSRHGPTGEKYIKDAIGGSWGSLRATTETTCCTDKLFKKKKDQGGSSSCSVF